MKAQSDHPVLHPTLTRSDARQQRRGNFFNPTHLVYEIEHHHGAPRRKAYFNSRDARKGSPLSLSLCLSPYTLPDLFLSFFLWAFRSTAS